MINLALALVAGLAGFALFYFTHIAPAWGSILPGVVAAVVTYVLLARRTMKQLEAVMAAAQKEVAGQRIEKAVAILEGAFPLARWQFLVGSQLHGQIGALLYVQKKFEDAEPHLRKSFVKMGTARAMLGAQHFRRKEWKEMESVFDAAVRANKGDSLLYAVYAFCEDKRGERKRAIEILQKGVSEVKSDERLKTLLGRLQNDKRMKLEAFGGQWYQFWLETPPMSQGPGGGFGPRQVRWGRR
jgi:tetratricopeptide (TPR) repeat protein